MLAALCSELSVHATGLAEPVLHSLENGCLGPLVLFLLLLLLLLLLLRRRRRRLFLH